MDLDLFGAFEGNETAKVEPLSRKSGDGPGGSPGGSKKRPRVEEKAEAIKPAVKSIQAPAPVQLVHGGDKEVVREDGTRVKSYSVYPADWKVDEDFTPPDKPAKSYPFKLDPFQEQAISYIERNESVLVSAHTSAGKTVNAEYAIAKSLRNNQRVVYTSPIKALSNQKFRDLQEEFGDVGLMTGDITINPDATCLIMTTEILRSMLYRGSEIMREVAWVIYDEVHYMRDKSRGVVWEESIILLPHKVRFVFLSATIPNAKEFCAWIATLHHQPCHVVYTDYRPVPLMHYVYPANGEGLHLVVDDKGKFREDNFQRALATLQSAEDPNSGPGCESVTTQSAKKWAKKAGGDKQGSELKRIVKLIMQREYDPVIVFSFSKQECEANAMAMAKLNFNDEDEQILIQQIFVNAMDSLAEEDRSLPQIEAMLPLLKRGIGIHHGGLLPILKEVVEILFQESLVKCLFATETFSIGLNMPARTVVFTNVRKFDGVDFRWITSGEYIQMSGRAGRRGKDDRGIVIQMLDEKMDPAVAKDILYGDADALYSSYHISYNMLLNMLRVEGTDPEFLVKSSFHQFQQEQAAPALENEAYELEQEAAGIEVQDEEEVIEYYGVEQQLKKTKREILATICEPQYCLPLIQVGRLVRVNQVAKGLDWGWGAVVNMHKRQNNKEGEAVYEVECLLPHSPKSTEGNPLPGGDKDERKVIPVSLKDLESISSIRIYMPKDLRPRDSRDAVFKSIREILRRFPDGVPMPDPVKDLGITSDAFTKLTSRESALKKRLKEVSFNPKKEGSKLRLELCEKKMELKAKAKLLKTEAKAVQGVVMRTEMKRMKRVLRRLGHCDSSGVVALKGRVACEVNTCDELVVVELIFNSVFNELSLAQTAALMSCLVNEGKSKEGTPDLRPELQGIFRQLQDAARQVAKASVEAKLEMDPEEFVAGFNASIMELTYAWSQGGSFVEVMKLTTMYEGSVVRVLRRLEELLRQLGSAARNIGNAELQKKFEDSAATIRRGVVFSASLYL
ncbi:unnamed protein product [Chrysoparadoxa australica]